MNEFGLGKFIVGVFISGGGASLVAYLLLKSFGEKWLDSKFEKKLELSRHENAKEIQQLKADVDGLLNATLRIQQKEFDALSNCHNLMNIAFGQTDSYVRPAQGYPDISTLEKSAAIEFLKTFDFLAFQLNDIVNSERRNEMLQELLLKRKFHSANAAHIEFNNAIFKNEIFMEEGISKDFRSISTKIIDAISSKQISTDANDFKMGNKAYNNLVGECRDEVDRLTKFIRKKFFNQHKPSNLV